MKHMSLKDKVVFITGASAGIGAATAMAFAAQGARLLLAARRAGKLAEVASLALERGAAAVHSIDLDVRNRHAVQFAIDELPQEWAEIDVLVNNAGLSRGMEKLYTGRIEDWEEMIDTNVKGLLYVARAVVPGMVVRGRGHVITLGSICLLYTSRPGQPLRAGELLARSLGRSPHPVADGRRCAMGQGQSCAADLQRIRRVPRSLRPGLARGVDSRRAHRS